MKKNITIIGSGMMGSGIAASSAVAGHRTIIFNINPNSLEKASEIIIKNINQLVEGGLVSLEKAGIAKELLFFETDLEKAVQQAGIVIEAITEDLKIKQEVFKKIDALADKDVIITSNTSGLRISDISKDLKYPERTATTHFWFPAHLVLLVEIVKGEKTSPETTLILRDLLNSWGKTSVIVTKDLPGQLANRILQAIIREAIHIVESGLASAEDVDTAIKGGMALRFPVWGPLEHIDGVGLDLALSVQKDVLPNLNNSKKPSAHLEKLHKNGDLGYKTGKGFYDWSTKDMKKLADCRDSFIIKTIKLINDLKAKKKCA